MYEKNGIETIEDNDGIFWLNEKYIEGLDHINLQEIITKYNSNIENIDITSRRTKNR